MSGVDEKWNIDEKWKKEDYDELLDIIEKTCERIIKNYGLVSYKAAKVDYVNENGTCNLILPESGTILGGVKTTITVEAGDNVELSCKGGNLSNSWVSVKHG